MKNRLVLAAISISLLMAGASYAVAEPGAGARNQARGDASTRAPQAAKARVEMAKKLADGQVHTKTITNGQGETATRSMQVIKDKEAGVMTINQSGTTFKGEAYSRETTMTKTDTGFTRESLGSAPNGNAVSTNVVGVVDESAKTITRTITRVDKDGVSTTETKVSPLPPKKAEAEGATAAAQ
jgi:hypothetical protein